MLLRALILAALLMGASANAAPQSGSPGAMPTPAPGAFPNLRVERIAIDGPGTTKGRWYNVHVRNTGRGPLTAERTPIRARVQVAASPGSTHSELLLLTCAIPDSWAGGSAPCTSAFVGRLAPGERVIVRAFLQADPGLHPLPYRVEIGVDVCGAGFVPDVPPLTAGCRIVESNESDNTAVVRVRLPTGTGG